ncbi:hypothetical protein [Endozoicomonas sp. Mp262]|uniref:hypothetical protein n=1 Tax=Endozoicomonas sp. Mp262 TaxID=2919499 RepID=UPI0021D8A468
MCGGGGGGSASPDYSVQNRQVALARQLESDYQSRFLPYERQLVSQATDKGRITEAVSQSKAAAETTFDASQGQSERQLSGFGATLTASQQAALNSQRQRDRNVSSMAATSNARQQSANRYGQLQSSMMAIGRNAQNQGLTGINQAAGMENQRNIANQQMAAQKKSDGWGLLGTGIGMAAGYMISDKNKKRNIKPRSDKEDMDDARSFGNYEYDYKAGQSGGRSEFGHVGGMAQEMPESMSDGKQVDLGDATMVAFGAIRDIDKRLQQLESRQPVGSKG